MILWIMDTQGIGQFELSKRSGLSPAAIFQILKKSEKEVTQPPRRSTVSALAQAVNADVKFDSKKNLLHLVRRYEVPDTGARELNRLLAEIGRLISGKRKEITTEERERIVRVVKALLD